MLWRMAGEARVIRSVRDKDLPLRDRILARYRRWHSRVYEPTRPGDHVLLRLLRHKHQWQHARRPPVSCPDGRAIAEALRANERMLKRLVARTEHGEKRVELETARWEGRLPGGIKQLVSGGVTYQTLANDLRTLAAWLDALARRDRGDLPRHD